jgi:hypothetical protein
LADGGVVCLPLATRGALDRIACRSLCCVDPVEDFCHDETRERKREVGCIRESPKFLAN